MSTKSSQSFLIGLSQYGFNPPQTTSLEPQTSFNPIQTDLYMVKHFPPYTIYNVSGF